MASLATRESNVEQLYFKLNSGHEIPAVGLGTWKACPNVVRDAVFNALVAGYRHIDAAFIYGNQEQVGAGLQRGFATGIQRKDVFVTSKLWIKMNSPEKVKVALQETLNELGLDYLDLYLIHWPVFVNPNASMPPKRKEDILPWDIVGTWKAMEGLVKEGLVRHIGVSNFSVPKLEILLKEATVMPAVHQVEMHPALRNNKILQHAKANKYHVTAYSPLGSSKINLLNDPAVSKVAKKLGKDPAQILIRWCIQHGVSVIPKSSKEERIKANFDVFNWSIRAEDMEELDSLPYQKRTCPGIDIFVAEGEDAHKALGEFWDEEVKI